MMRTKHTKKYFLFIFLSILLMGFKPLQTDDPSNENINITITQVDTSEFPQVTVYVSATDATGEPTDFDPNGIVLEEDGTIIKPEQVLGSGEIGPLTTMLVMDVSGSMNAGGKLEAAKEAAKAYIDQMRPGDSAGLIIFNTSIDLMQEVTENQKALKAAIRNLKATKDTAMYDALESAVEILAGYEGRKAIIVLTDGLDNMSKSSPEMVLRKIGPAGLTISTIGLGDPTHGKGAQTALDEHALIALAGDAGGVYAYAEEEEALMEIYKQYGRALQAECSLTYSSPSVFRDGVNRSLSVSYDSESSLSGAGKYNPGGLIPETTVPETWSLFSTLLIGLLILLIIPTMVSSILSLASKERKIKTNNQIKLQSRVKLKE